MILNNPDANNGLGTPDQKIGKTIGFGVRSEIGGRETDEDSLFAASKGKTPKFRLAEAGRVADEYNKAKQAGSVPPDLEARANALSQDSSEVKVASEQVFDHGVDSLFIVADGAGGHGAGDRASEMTVKEVLKGLAQTPDWKTLSPAQRKEAIKNAVVAANTTVFNTAQAEHTEMMSTLTMAVVIDGEVYVANAGDSRTYIQDEKGNLVQLTKDHSLVQALVDRGMLSESEKATHPQRNYVLQSVGGKKDINVDVFDPVQISGKARLLLCCDGLWESIPNKDELSQVLASQGMSPEQISAALIQKAQENIANGNETNDNITAVVADLDVDKTAQKSTPVSPLPTYVTPPLSSPPIRPLDLTQNFSDEQAERARQLLQQSNTPAPAIPPVAPIAPQPAPAPTGTPPMGSGEWAKRSLENFGNELGKAVTPLAEAISRTVEKWRNRNQPAAARRQALDSGQQLDQILDTWGKTLQERQARRQVQPASGVARVGHMAGDVLLGATAFGVSGAGKEAAKILLGPSGLAIAAVGGGLQSAVRGVGELTRNGGLETAMQRQDVKGLNLFGRYADVETYGARGAVRIVDILQRKFDSPAEKQDRDELLGIIHGSGAEFSAFVGPDRDFNPDNLIKALSFIDSQQLTAEEKLQYKARLSAQAVRTLGRSSQIGYADIDSSKAAELDKFLIEALTQSTTFVEQFQNGTDQQKTQANELIAIMAESHRSRKNMLALKASYLFARTGLGAAKAVAVFEVAQGIMGLFRGTPVLKAPSTPINPRFVPPIKVPPIVPPEVPPSSPSVEVLIPQHTTAGQMVKDFLGQHGVQNQPLWGKEGAKIWGTLAHENVNNNDFWSQSFKMASSAQAQSLDGGAALNVFKELGFNNGHFNEGLLDGLISKAQGGDLESIKKLQALWRWLPPGTKIKIPAGLR